MITPDTIFWMIICRSFSMDQLHFARGWADEIEEGLFQCESSESRIKMGEFIRLCQDGVWILEADNDD